MRIRLLVALAAGLLVGAADPAPDVGEVVRYQVIPPGSKWARTDDDGRTWVDQFGRDGVWRSVCTSNKEIIMAPVNYTLDPTASPPRIDARRKWGWKPGIYRLDGDRLLICLGKWKTSDRPTTFAHRPREGQWLYTLKRLK